MAVGTLVGVASHGLFSSALTPTCDYPAESDVRDGVVYGDGTLTGNVELPAESDVLLGVGYGSLGTEYTGTYEGDTPVSPAVAGTMPFSLILSRIVARVAAALGTTTTFVRPVSADDYAVTETENLFSYLRAYGPSPTNPTTGANYNDDGAGRWRRVVGRRIRVYIYTRSGVDTYGGDEIALMGQNPAQLVTDPITLPAQYALEECVLNALDNYVMTYTDDLGVVYPLTIGPTHWIDSESGPAVRKPENEAGLTRSHLDFQILYSLAVQRVEPAPSGLPVPNPM